MSMARSNIELNLQAIAAPVADHCEQAERLLMGTFESAPPWIERLIVDRTILGGKRLRPLLLLLSGAACGALMRRHHQLAAAMELIHLASLIHDDLIDGATTRRRVPTVNHLHGATNSVLLGDWLYAQAFVMAAQSQSVVAVEILARSIRAVCEGEIRQHQCQGDLDLALDDYLQMIDGKTASLCAAACEIGAVLSGATETRRRPLREYGRQLGIAFQVVDDILDLVGVPERMGKTLRTDLSNRRITAPLIYALSCQRAEMRYEMRRQLQTDALDQTSLMNLIEESGAIDRSWDLALEYCRGAQALAARVEDPWVAQSLSQLAEFVVQRTY